MEDAFSDEWTTLESLILVSIVSQTSTAINWATISKQLRSHPLFDSSRDPTLFGLKRCQQQFEYLVEHKLQYERKKPGIQDQASRLEEKLKDERRKEVEAQIASTAQEIRALKSDVQSIRAGKQDSALTEWFNERRAAEIQDLKLTAQALADAKSKPTSSSTPPPGVDPETYAKIEKVLKKLHQIKQSEPFRRPVTADDLEDDDDYYDVIKNPTDLTTIRLKLQHGLIKTKQDLWKELSLLFDNALKFNEVGTSMHSMTLNFREHAIKEMETIFSSDSVASTDGISTRYGRKK